MSQVVPYHLETMKFGSSMEDEDSDYLQLFFPLVVAHKIDASSPLFELSPKDLQAKQFEIILSLEGTTPETGNTIQVFYYWQSSQFCLFVRKLFEVISLLRCEHLTCQVKYYGVNGFSTQQWLTIKMLLSLVSPTRPLMPWRMTALQGRFNFKF